MHQTSSLLNADTLLNSYDREDLFMDELDDSCFESNTLNVPPMLEELMLNLLTRQDSLNKEFLGEDWRSKSKDHSSIDYCAALLEEAVELLNCNKVWKFWKTPDAPDLENMKLEFVDLLHFAMSEAMASNPEAPLESIASDMAFWYMEAYRIKSTTSTPEYPTEEELLPKPTGHDFVLMKKSLLAYLSESFAVHQEFVGGDSCEENPDSEDFAPPPPTDWQSFWKVAYWIGLGLSEVAAIYQGKAQLNSFRVSKSDKQGLYDRKWFYSDEVEAVEDNKLLMEFIAETVQKEKGILTTERIGAWLEEAYAKHLRLKAASF